jgi:hypothetical protein
MRRLLLALLVATWPATAAGQVLSSPSVALQGTTATADLGADGYSWASGRPLTVDKYGKLIAWAQRHSLTNHRPIVSNNGGTTWVDVAISGMFDANGEGFLTRESSAYDSVNDLLHVIWEGTAFSDGIIYRRYSFTRDGFNNITTITRVSGVNLQIDADSSYSDLRNPVILWQNAGGANGQILVVWGAYYISGSPNRAELRASMRVLSNTTADNTASNWKAPVTDDATTMTLDAIVPYSILYSRSNFGTLPQAAIHRKTAGTHINDVYVGFSDGNNGVSGGGWKMLRLPWDSGAADWSNTIVSVTLDNVLIAGTDTGYSLKYQLVSQISEDVINDRVWVGYALWLSDAAGDTWAARYVDTSDTASSRVVVYSAGGAHSYAPVGDLVADPLTGYVAISYAKTSTTHAYVQVFDGTTQVQAETLLFSGEAVDIPLFWSGGRTAANKLLVLFRSSTGTPTPPYDGYFGTMRWPAAAGAPTLVQKRCEAANHYAASTSKTINFGATTTAGNLLIVLLQTRNGSTISSLVNSAAEAFTQDRFDDYSGDASSRAWIYSRANAAASTSVTVTVNATFANAALICALEVSGIVTTTPLDQTTSGEGSSATGSSGNITTTLANTFVVYVVGSSAAASWTGDASFTTLTYDVGSTTNSVAGYLMLSSTATVGAVATTPIAETWVNLIAAYKGTGTGGGGGSTPASRLTLIGVSP